MPECTIPALIAAIEFLTASSPTQSNTLMTPCHINSSSSACYEYMAGKARAEEDAYRVNVTDVLEACRKLEDREK